MTIKKEKLHAENLLEITQYTEYKNVKVTECKGRQCRSVSRMVHKWGNVEAPPLSSPADNAG